ncbi:MAG: class I adenylate-forming enzyme family protein [Aestuariivirga sp.]
MTMASGIKIGAQITDSEIPTSLALHYGQIAMENQRFPAIMREQQIITHGEFWQIVKSFAAHMKDEGVGTGSLVALNTTDILGLVATLFATSLLGARFTAASKVLATAKILRPTHFFRTPEVTGTRRVNFRIIDDSWLPTSQSREQEKDFAGNAKQDADWLYLHTSGTTGQAKYFALSEKMIMDRTAAVAKDFPFQRTTLATTFAAGSRPFIIRAIATMLNAGAIVDSRNFEHWRKVGVNLVCGSPLQVGELLKGVSFVPRVARIEVSGAKLPDDIAMHLLENFALVVDVFGAGETSKTFENIVMRDGAGRICRKGNPLDSEVQIVSASGQPRRAAEAGLVRIRNPYMINGYLQAPQATAKFFRDGWFYSGDIAVWGEHGELLVIGREDDVINIGGHKLNAGMLDMLFRSVPGIRDAVAFHNPKPHAVDMVLVFVVLGEDAVPENVAEAACQIARTRIGLSISPSSIRGINEIPKTEDGSPDREACRRLVLKRTQLP